MPPQSRYTENNGTRLHYTIQGDGPLIIAVHGFPDYHGGWDDILPYLTDGYRIAAMDLRGYNLSDQPERLEDYSIQTMCQDIMAVMNAEGANSAILMGHDLGAAFSWQLAINAPDIVRQLIIFSVPHPALFRQEIGANPDQKTRSDYARAFQQEGSEDELTVDKIIEIMQLRDEEKIAKYRAAFERSSFRSMMNIYRTSFPKGTRPRPADPSALPKVKAPTLIIHGMKDVALTTSGHDGTWAFMDSDLTFMTLPNAGHWVHHNEPALVGRTVRTWLDIRTEN